MADPPGSLSEITHRVTRAQLVKYADASGDHNPLHLDEEFAAGTPYGRTIAHGMLVLAFVSELMAKSFGAAWLCQGKLKARFRSPVYPGDTVTTSGTLQSTAGTTTKAEAATYEVIVRNQDDTVVLTAQASVPLGG